MRYDELLMDLYLDPAQLDVQCVKQADRFFYWAEKAVRAHMCVQELENELELLTAKLQLDVRNNPAKYGLSEKPTEAAIKAAVTCIPELQDKIKGYHAALSEKMLLEKAVAAMDMKKRQLENLIALHGQQYFAGPDVPRDLVSAWAEHQKRMDEELQARQAQAARRVRRV